MLTRAAAPAAAAHVTSAGSTADSSSMTGVPASWMRRSTVHRRGVVGSSIQSTAAASRSSRAPASACSGAQPQFTSTESRTPGPSRARTPRARSAVSSGEGSALSFTWVSRARTASGIAPNSSSGVRLRSTTWLTGGAPPGAVSASAAQGQASSTSASGRRWRRQSASSSAVSNAAAAAGARCSPPRSRGRSREASAATAPLKPSAARSGSSGAVSRAWSAATALSAVSPVTYGRGAPSPHPSKPCHLRESRTDSVRARACAVCAKGRSIGTRAVCTRRISSTPPASKPLDDGCPVDRDVREPVPELPPRRGELQVVGVGGEVCRHGVGAVPH